MKKLVSFIHVSTAYCHCGETVLEEKPYLIPISPETMMEMVDSTDDTTLESLTPKLIGDQPNTYAFSKALSEDLITRCGLPIGVARPSIGILNFLNRALMKFDFELNFVLILSSKFC